MSEDPNRVLGAGARGEDEPQPEYGDDMVEKSHGDTADADDKAEEIAKVDEEDEDDGDA